MTVENFTAAADLVGHRVVLRWDARPGAGGDAAVRVRRKERDFEPEGRWSPVYDSTAFPPPGTEVTEAAPPGGGTVESCARDGVEVLRRVRRRHGDGWRVEILDVGGSAAGLRPGTTYYYELVAAPPGDGPDGEPETGPPLRAVATPTGLHRSGALLYGALPEIYRRHDVVRGPDPIGAVPESTPGNGQLRRFLDVFGAALDHLRSRADQLRGLHDVDAADHRLLPHLAALVGWEPSLDRGIAVRRHEVKYAAALYRITGTTAGCVVWVRRLTGWDARIKEFWRNVLITNDPGDPGDPGGGFHGSRTLDTSDPEAMAGLGRFEDTASYTYDTGTGPDSRYAHNLIGIFVAPRESVDEVLRLRGRLLSGASRFLPMNLRPVVVIETEPERRAAVDALGVSDGTDEVVA
ncbi:hypothetical protein GCM10010156_40750 [Planobispora rosea]|uniref:Uncharacterized protein n=1 Tax=Planobispora rosea TaxID=35762 RepID=A0A8J3RZ02_PLARO|nr:phage tail protein [Planobispora rosea]GGS77810.1 hypothetical protein GCM10010156_40750 [Planobispora rosea]GIH85601.1 hypothetical protein Pro02_40090 [Planobispora rosea]